MYNHIDFYVMYVGVWAIVEFVFKSPCIVQSYYDFFIQCSDRHKHGHVNHVFIGDVSISAMGKCDLEQAACLI